jgi:hypothetical protein
VVGTTDVQTLTNKSLQDSTTFFVDNADGSKKLQFELSGITTATTRTLTVPNYNGTLSTLDGTETFTNKTLQDSTTYIADNADATKKFQFQASGITTATTRTYTVPDKNGTVAMVSDIGYDHLVTTNSASDFSALDYTTSVFSADYDIYMIEIRKLYATVNTSNKLMLRVFDNGSLVTTGYDYHNQNFIDNGTSTNTAPTNQAAFQLTSETAQSPTDGTNSLITGWIKIYAYPGTASGGGGTAFKDCVVQWDLYQKRGTTVQYVNRGVGRVALSSSTSPSQIGVRLYPSVSNEINGVFEVYGIRNS